MTKHGEGTCVRQPFVKANVGARHGGRKRGVGFGLTEGEKVSGLSRSSFPTSAKSSNRRSNLYSHNSAKKVRLHLSP